MLLRTPTIIAMFVDATSSYAAVTLMADSTQQCQTWEGWEVTQGLAFHFEDAALGDKHSGPQKIIDEILDHAVNNLGLTALDVPISMEGKDPLQVHHKKDILEPVNDNNDPFVLGIQLF